MRTVPVSTSPRSVIHPSRQQQKREEAQLRREEDQQLIEELQQLLLAANARIAVQAEALTDAAAEQERLQQLEFELEVSRHRIMALETERALLLRNSEGMTEFIQKKNSSEATQSEHMAFDDMKENHEGEVKVLMLEIQQLRQELATLQQKYDDTKAQADRWREQLGAAQGKNEALDSRVASVLSEVEAAKAAHRTLKSKEKEWRAERAQLYSEIDKNTTNSIMRREELYFTRTNLLKETARLRTELEVRPLPDPDEVDPPYWLPRDPARLQRVQTATRRPPKPPPKPFICGIAPRAPRAMEKGKAFQDEVVSEFRAAEYAVANERAERDERRDRRAQARPRSAAQAAETLGVGAPRIEELGSPVEERHGEESDAYVYPNDEAMEEELDEAAEEEDMEEQEDEEEGAVPGFDDDHRRARLLSYGYAGRR